jgi:hypothetical protein
MSFTHNRTDPAHLTVMPLRPIIPKEKTREIMKMQAQLVVAASLVVGMSSLAQAQMRVYDRTVAVGSGAINNLVSGVVDSSDPTKAYQIMSGQVASVPSHRITATVGVGTSPTSTDLFATSSYNSVSNGYTGLSTAPNGIAGLLFDVGTQLQFVEATTATRGIFRVNKSNGVVTSVLPSLASFNALVGTGGVVTSTAASNGDAIMFGSGDSSISRVTGTGTTVFDLQLLAANTGGGLTVQGITAAPNDDLYFGNNNTIAGARGLWRIQNAGTTPTYTRVLNLDSSSGTPDNFANGGLFYAPDGDIYFRTQSGDIRKFDLDTSTVSTVYSAATLTAVLGNNQVSNFTWLDGNIAWFNNSTLSSGAFQGLYTVPEPAMLGLLAGFGALLLKRRK